ncbi:ParB/RepB/Spo0J family partition protein [Mesorhizobium sp.]|uniref:ParB/RepB/Spo0J family partition protein n=1 Tax=Mesorhizobium sp. TaxID=1871066 RepID=UPI0025800E42|nr:ParB/RepB/Spo0J family partition protein [Mesorhizobium sp.]
MLQAKPEIVEASALLPNPWNTNIMTPENEAKLEASLDRLGFFRPVIVRETDQGLQIIGGEHRWEIAKKKGLKVPIMNLGKIPDRKAKEIGIADNERYGVDDTIAFAEFLKEMGDTSDLQEFLPYTATDFAEIFSSVDIALDDLDIEENFENSKEKEQEAPAAKAPKTHTIMRFKVPLGDAERITALIASTQKTHHLTGSDELTNAGDALVQLLLSSQAPAGEGASVELDDLELEAVQ